MWLRVFTFSLLWGFILCSYGVGHAWCLTASVWVHPLFLLESATRDASVSPACWLSYVGRPHFGWLFRTEVEGCLLVCMSLFIVVSLPHPNGHTHSVTGAVQAICGVCWQFIGIVTQSFSQDNRIGAAYTDNYAFLVWDSCLSICLSIFTETRHLSHV